MTNGLRVLTRLLAVVVTALLAVALTSPARAAMTSVHDVRAWPGEDHTRVVFDVSGPVEHRIFQLANPHRLVIDLSDARLRSAPRAEVDGSREVRRIRYGRRSATDLRVVLDLTGPVQPRSFLLPPGDRAGHRLVVDVRTRQASAQPVARQTSVAAAARPVIIAIDAGHGGQDPGAIGSRGTREKDITLAVARKLKAAIDTHPGFQGYLVRDGDYYLKLRERIERARQAGADLLVSVHADAFKDRRVRGSSVWVLSPRGASSEAARWLAERENAADLVGGVSLDDKDDVLAQVLLDLSQTATLNDSLEVASVALAELKRVGHVHKPHVDRAGFVVLKAPDIPSVLVETAFISNPSEEARLRDERHQQRLATALARGFVRYFERKPPPGTLLAARRHVIEHGETLSGIASRYAVSVEHIKASNRLADDDIRVGQVLRIPVNQGS